MKVGDLIRPANGFRTGGKIEIVEIEEGFFKRILVKYHDRTTLDGDPLLSWEAADEFVVDVQRTREERLKEIGIV